MKIDPYDECYDVLLSFRNVFCDKEYLAVFYNTRPDIVRGFLKKKYLSLVDFEVWSHSKFLKGEKGVPDEEVSESV